MYFYRYEYIFSLYVYVWLTWLRFFRAFSSVVRQMPGKTLKDGARSTLFLAIVLLYVFLCCSKYCLFCVILCSVCVYMCTELLPPGGYPIAIKYIISYHFNDYNENFHKTYVKYLIFNFFFFLHRACYYNYCFHSNSCTYIHFKILIKTHELTSTEFNLVTA
jgi:hypothetical protein